MTATPTSVPATIWRTYYFAGSQRLALRVQGDPVTANNGVFFFVADHLGSTSVTLCGNTGGCNGVSYGGKVGEMKYYPYGDTRYIWGSTPTDRRFTGQRQDSYIKSLFLRARYYSSETAMFLSEAVRQAERSKANARNVEKVISGRPTAEDAAFILSEYDGFTISSLPHSQDQRSNHGHHRRWTRLAADIELIRRLLEQRRWLSPTLAHFFVLS